MCVALWGHNDNLLQVKRSYKLHAILKSLVCFFLQLKDFLYSTCKGEKTLSEATQSM